MTAATPGAPDHLALADALAKRHRLFIVSVVDRVFDKKADQWRYVPAWVVYRKSAAFGQRPARLGRRRDPQGLLRFVRQLTNVQPQGGQHAAPL